MKYNVVMTDDRHVDYEIERAILAEIGALLTICNCHTPDEVLVACHDADGILLNMAPMPRSVVEDLERCKVISRYGVGYDNVDVDACTEKGIQLTNVPDYCAEDVSDHALALLFSCLRQTALRDRLIRQGQWNIQSAASVRLKGKTLGVLGAGRIARVLIGKVSGFGFGKILVYDPYVPAEAIAACGAEKAELETVLREADIVSLHMPVTIETRGIINQKTLAIMKPSAILINSARGPLVEDTALIAALKNGGIAFAGLDTHNHEPLKADSEYLMLENVVLTDHTAYNTAEAVVELKTKSAQNIVRALCGEPPVYPVNTLK
ncbi:MAG: C-terminal binding protein [Eubacteriales bacterium]|nr:C-terminal binding protein [Eubacteriales bacterium]